jgi:hypothetical protein
MFFPHNVSFPKTKVLASRLPKRPFLGVRQSSVSAMPKSLMVTRSKEKDEGKREANKNGKLVKWER